MTNREYFKLVQSMPTHWLIKCVKNPNKYMERRDILRILLVLRNRGISA